MWKDGEGGVMEEVEGWRRQSDGSYGVMEDIKRWRRWSDGVKCFGLQNIIRGLSHAPTGMPSSTVL